jgi:hypothetical protein
VIGRPETSEFAPVAAGYVSLVPEVDILRVMESQSNQMRSFALTISPEREMFSYAPGKWSVREVIGHVTDAERVFGHRAFCISRGEQAHLPGFDEQAYAAQSSFASCRLSELVEEFALVREANLVFLRRLDSAAWRQIGTANDTPVSVRALAFVMAGHVRHHLHWLSTRYS